MKISKLMQVLIIISLLPAVLWAQEEDKKASRRSPTQIYTAVATWREESLLVRSDGQDYKLDTLNTVGRIGLTHYIAAGRYFLRYGLVLGHSQNSSAIDTFAYFQRSVLLTGAEVAMGLPFFLRPGVEMNFSLGGVYRNIKHSLPSADYKMASESRFVPLLSWEYLWRLSQSVYWRQGIGTQGKVGDTYWTAGLGYDW